jgi:GTP-binding protein Era
MTSSGRSLSTSEESFHEVQREPTDECKILKAVIVGSPNAGKSTLSNRLLGRKIFAVSPKVHTTRHRSLGTFVKGATQIVLLDTPGIVDYRYGRKLKMSKELLTDAEQALMEADLGVLVVDASDKQSAHLLPPEICRTIWSYKDTPFALALNKVDLIRHKRVLLEMVDKLTRMLQTYLDTKETNSNDTRACLFHEVFMISALTGDGVDSLRDFLVSSAYPGKWVETTTTRLSLLTVVEDIVREKLFLYLHKEIPYVIRQSNELWEESEDVLTVMQYLTCTSQGQKSIVIGPAGRTIQKITEEAKEDIQLIIGKSVDLTLHVRTMK